MNILLLGPPGAGKGTQAKIISEKFNIPIISMGDMLRGIIKKDEELKLKILPYMKSGGLIPSELVGKILKKRILEEDCEKGFILDGYPRNEEQAKLLDEINLKVDKAIEIFVSDEEILKRLTSRKVCGKCGEIFSVNFKKPKKDGICDFCNSELVTRPDDEEKTIKKRLEVFRKQTIPLEKYYENQNKLYKVNGQQDAKRVSEELFLIIEGKRRVHD